MYVEKDWRQIHKTAASFTEQDLETPPHKTAPVRPAITKTIQATRTRYVGLCQRSKDELISDLLSWTPSHGRAMVGRPARTDIQLFCADTGCSLEDLLGAIDDRDTWRERGREIRVGSVTWWWWIFELYISWKVAIHVKWYYIIFARHSESNVIYFFKKRKHK